MKCPNCGATLAFNAGKGVLECRFCESTFDPDGSDLATSGSARAEERSQPGDGGQQPLPETIGYTAYICASCGAELAGTYDTSAIGFCSYCGGESIIASRIDAQRPDRIVPFSRSKESCKEIYMKTVGHLPFVPKALKQEKHVDEIRGIYVPYNIYRTHHEGAVDLEYTKHDSSYNYRYALKGEVSSDCAVPIDASVQLDDYIGSTVFPYETGKEVPFSENYLSTYYVELPDADDSVYLPAVIERVLEYENDCATKSEEPDSIYDQRDTGSEDVEMAGKDIMLAPLYFLTYKNKDKVCYTVLSGANDNDSIYAEVPVDIPKYLAALTVVAYVNILMLKGKNESIDIKYSHILFAVSALMIALGFAEGMVTIPDEAMYAMMFASFTAALVGFHGIIKAFNATCERERPHFTREGGHNAAQDIR